MCSASNAGKRIIKRDRVFNKCKTKHHQNAAIQYQGLEVVRVVITKRASV